MRTDFYYQLTGVWKTWATLKPDKKLSGMTHEDFVNAIEPSRLARKEVAALEERLVSAMARLMRADIASRKLLQRVAHSARTDQDLGENSEIYRRLRRVSRQ
jgi:hypothetical protein